MKQLYDKPVYDLMKDFVTKKGLNKNQIINIDDIASWFEEKYPLVKKNTIDAHIRWLTTNRQSRVNHKPNLNGKHDLFFQLEDKTIRLYNKETDPKPIYE